MLLVWGSVGAAGYDLCAVDSCAIPSWGKGTMDAGLAMSYLYPDCTTFMAFHLELHEHWGKSSRFGLLMQDQSGII